MTELYRVQVTARAARDLDRLPEKIATACAKFIFGPLADNPGRVGKPLRDELSGLHAARRGDYRIVYSIDLNQRSVQVIGVDRRSDVYRRRQFSAAAGGPGCR